MSKDDNAGQSVGHPGAGLRRRGHLARPRLLRVDRRVYAIGPKTAKTLTGTAVDAPAEKGDGAPA